MPVFGVAVAAPVAARSNRRGGPLKHDRPDKQTKMSEGTFAETKLLVLVRRIRSETVTALTR